VVLFLELSCLLYLYTSPSPSQLLGPFPEA
jgi:hypothetical protein